MFVRNTRTGGPVIPELYRRVRWALLLAFLVFLVLLIRLAQLQISRGDKYYEKTLKNVVKQRMLPAVRGRVVDARGNVLAATRHSYHIEVQRKFFGDLRASLIDLLGLDSAQIETIERMVAEAEGEYTWVRILENQSEPVATLLEQELFARRGIAVRTETFRQYPHGALASHLVGYLGHPTPEELQAMRSQGLRATDWVGRMGIERGWEQYLRGAAGVERFVENARHRRVRGAEADALLGDAPRLEPPLPGHTIVLTLDVNLQEAVEAAVRELPIASVVVAEVETGRILSLVSKPSFDSNSMTGRLSHAQYQELLADPRKPFVDKTLAQHYPPGSVFKFVTAIAALQAGAVTEKEKLTCEGHHEVGAHATHKIGKGRCPPGNPDCFNCTGVHGELDLTTAIKVSCNVYFMKLAERIGLDRISEVAREFGFGAPSGLGLNADAKGRIPVVSDYKQFVPGFAVQAAYGQGDVLVTAVQVAMAYVAIANGGVLYRPQIVSRVERADGTTLIPYPPEVRRKIAIAPEHVALLKQGMWQVVNEKGGTAFEFAYSDAVEYAGKTGTAEIDIKDAADHAWFAGYGPVAKPEIVVVVLIPSGGAGGRVAAPVAKQVFLHYAKTHNWPTRPRVAPALPVQGVPTGPAEMAAP